MVLTRSLARFLSPFVLFLAVACGDEAVVPNEIGSETGGATGVGGGAPEPSLRFYVDERPHDASDDEIETDEALWGDPIRIVGDSLPPERRLRFGFSNGAWAVLMADAAGVVDLARDAPLEGSWLSADADGFLWSGTPSNELHLNLTVTVVDEATGELLADGSFRRKTLDDGIEVVSVQDGTRVGIIAKPAGARGPLPAVLAFGGSEGGTWYGEIVARYLAQRGYVAFGAGYFKAPGLPNSLERVPLEILADDLDYLASLPEVDSERIAVLGASRGGELALLLGAIYPERVRAVVAQVPSGYVWGAATPNAVSAWTLAEADLPFVPDSGVQAEFWQEGDRTYVLSTPSFLADLAAASPESLAAATIDVTAALGSVLLLAGADDGLWPACVMSEVSWNALEVSGHSAEHPDGFHCFEDAGHLITLPPGTSTLASTELYNATYDVWFVMGGTPAGNATARRQGDTATRAFLEEALAAR